MLIRSDDKSTLPRASVHSSHEQANDGLPLGTHLLEVDMTVTVVVHVFESGKVVVAQPRMRPLVVVHVLVKLHEVSMMYVRIEIV